MIYHDKKTFGFTMIEVLLAVVVVAIMAGLAIPGYRNTMEDTRANEARVNLQIMRTGQMVRAMNDPNRSFWDPPANPPTMAEANAALNVDMASQFYNMTSMTVNNGATPKTFTILLTRNGVQGGNGTRAYRIDQDGNIVQTSD